MTEAGSEEDDDLVRIKPRRNRSGRIEVEVADTRRTVIAVEPAPARGGAPSDVILRSAAVLVDGERVPIPGRGLEIGAGEGVDIRVSVPGVANLQATIDKTAEGHVVSEHGARARTFVNGERLVTGERRPLRRGDTIAIASRLLHYLPAGPELSRLARVQPVDAGRLRTSRRIFTVGRDRECDLVLDHPTVSRHHAVIRLDRGSPTIEDRDSAVGVRVNGNRVRRAPLSVGDQISIGPYRIVFDGEELFEREVSPAGLAVVADRVQVDVEGGTILHPTSLHLRAGELVAIIGESGAGKSTLLRALAGVCTPTRGSVMVGGEDVRTCLCELGYVPQFDIVHDELTVAEALEFAARLRLPPDIGDRERATRVAEVIEQLGLADRAGVRVAKLSGGQRKRVAVGVELLHQPGALFLDEPTTGLDPGLERHMSQLFRRLARTGQTVALVTHATGSMTLFDRVIVMGRGGRLRFDGSPGELLEAFEVEQFDDVYELLAGSQEGAPARSESPHEAPPLPPAHPPAPSPRTVQHSLTFQTRVLAERYATLIARDRKHLRSALVQVPILALLTALLFTSDVFERLPVPHYAAKSAQLLFLMVTIAIWLGSINAAREIVKERNVLRRELAIGVQAPAYLASKLIVLLTFAAAQTLLFAVLVLSLRPLHESSTVAIQLAAILIVSSWVAVLLGLLVSAYSSSEDQATGVIPLLLVPQLLFSGAIVPSDDMTTPVRALAALVPARWSFAAAGHVVHMQARIDTDKIFGPVSRYGHSFFAVTVVEFLLIAFAFATVLFAGLTRLLRTASR